MEKEENFNTSNVEIQNNNKNPKRSKKKLLLLIILVPIVGIALSILIISVSLELKSKLNNNDTELKDNDSNKESDTQEESSEIEDNVNNDNNNQEDNETENNKGLDNDDELPKQYMHDYIVRELNSNEEFCGSYVLYKESYYIESNYQYSKYMDNELCFSIYDKKLKVGECRNGKTNYIIKKIDNAKSIIMAKVGNGGQQLFIALTEDGSVYVSRDFIDNTSEFEESFSKLELNEKIKELGSRGLCQKYGTGIGGIALLITEDDKELILYPDWTKN